MTTYPFKLSQEGLTAMLLGVRGSELPCHQSLGFANATDACLRFFLSVTGQSVKGRAQIVRNSADVSIRNF